jgi:hypothetical protein
MVKRVDNRRKQFSSSASVASTVADASILGKGIDEKMDALHDNLRYVKDRLSYKDYKELCACCLKSSDRLYPGFKDITLIVHYLLREDPSYKGMLSDREIDHINLAMIYQCIYQQLCEYLLNTTKGSDAMKMLTTPTKLTHATYDICRQKFCRILVDETDIIQYGIFRLVRKVLKHRKKTSSTPLVDVPPVLEVGEEVTNEEDLERRRLIEEEEVERLRLIEEEEKARAAEEAAAAAEESRLRQEVEEQEREERLREEEAKIAEEYNERLRAEEKANIPETEAEGNNTKTIDIDEDNPSDDEEEHLDMARSAPPTETDRYKGGPFFTPYGSSRAGTTLPYIKFPGLAADDDSVSSLEDEA